MSTFDQRSAAYRDGANAYNHGLSWRDNPHPTDTDLHHPWWLGFNDRRDQSEATS